jgi:hypothetical protein
VRTLDAPFPNRLRFAAMLKKLTSKHLNESQCCEIISKLSKTNPPSKHALAREYNVSEGAIRKVWEKRDSILERSALLSEKAKQKTFRASVGRFTKLEDMLYIWIDSMRRARFPIPPSLAITKAKNIAFTLSIFDSDFKASWQWLSCFRTRRGLQKMLLHGEGVEVDKNDLELLSTLEESYFNIAQYDPENVYNMDETGLFFRLLPRYSILMSNEDISSTRGKKKAKDCVSLIVCANASGTHKIPCVMIRKPKEPACIKDRHWLVLYFNQAKAWMDVETCWKWFNEVFVQEVKRRIGRPVLLLKDNAPGHFDAFECHNIRVVFFPPNCTSWKQPCDMGIIAAFKKRYKYLYLKDILDFYKLDEQLKQRKRELGKRLRRGVAGVSYGNPAHILHAANYVKEAWDSVSSSSIKNAFSKAELMNLELEPRAESENNVIAIELAQTIESLNLSINQSELEEFVHIDDESNEEYVATVLEDIEELLESMKINEVGLDENSDVNQPEQIVESQDKVEFHGFESLYKQILDIEDRLLCSNVQTEAEEAFDNLKKSFEEFQAKVRTIVLKARRKKNQNLRQMMIHDMFH